jgi:CheY-like chemotaxis protein
MNGVLRRPFELLLVEDNPGDVRLTREALRDHKILHNMNVVIDGEEALAFLRREGRFAAAPRPDLVFLDLNLPRLGGREVLDEIKRDPHLKAIPVVVLTSSQAEEDVARSYELGANCYIVKPVDFERFGKVIKALDSFWLAVVTLPPRR